MRAASKTTALPAALSRIGGNEVALFLPYYHKIKHNAAYVTEKVAEFRVQLGWRQQYCGVMKLLGRGDGVQVYFLDSEYYFGARTGATAAGAAAEVPVTPDEAPLPAGPAAEPRPDPVDFGGEAPEPLPSHAEPPAPTEDGEEPR